MVGRPDFQGVPRQFASRLVDSRFTVVGALGFNTVSYSSGNLDEIIMLFIEMPVSCGVQLTTTDPTSNLAASIEAAQCPSVTGGSDMFIPQQMLGGEFTLRLLNGTGANATFGVNLFSYIGAKWQDLLIPTHRVQRTNAALGAGASLEITNLVYSGYEDTLDVLGFSNQAFELRADWVWNPFGAAQVSVTEVLAVGAAGVAASAQVPIRAQGVRVYLVNTAGVAANVQLAAKVVTHL